MQLGTSRSNNFLLPLASDCFARIRLREALITLVRHGWGKPESAFLKMFLAMFIPDGTKEEIDALAELQRMTTTAENALRIREAVDRFDVRHLLANVAVPALVLYARNDSVHLLDQGLAAGIHGARFVMLESANHVTLPGSR